MKNREKKKVYAIEELCNGCRLCEMMCSFHHLRSFNPDKAYIRVAQIEDEGKDSPYISCEPNMCTDDPPECVKACPTGALVFCTLEEVVEKKQEYYRKRSVQPIFRVIAPWKWPFKSWKEWPMVQNEET